jgi:ribosome-binding protein aMBF1 (putative translation factor)
VRVGVGQVRYLYMYSFIIPRHELTHDERDYGARLGRALADARKGRGVSGGELSRLSGVSVDAIRSIEGGRVASPGFGLVAALGRALQLSLDALARQANTRGRKT